MRKPASILLIALSVAVLSLFLPPPSSVFAGSDRGGIMVPDSIDSGEVTATTSLVTHDFLPGRVAGVRDGIFGLWIKNDGIEVIEVFLTRAAAPTGTEDPIRLYPGEGRSPPIMARYIGYRTTSGTSAFRWEAGK